jgi:hypothetical protein
VHDVQSRIGEMRQQLAELHGEELRSFQVRHKCSDAAMAQLYGVSLDHYQSFRAGKQLPAYEEAHRAFENLFEERDKLSGARHFPGDDVTALLISAGYMPHNVARNLVRHRDLLNLVKSVSYSDDGPDRQQSLVLAVVGALAELCDS